MMTLEFAFVRSLPAPPVVDESEMTRAERCERLITALRAMVQKKGDVLPLPFVHRVLGVSRQRVLEMIEQGHLERVDFYDQVFVTVESLVRYINSNPRPGRPRKVPTIQEAWRMTQAAVKEM